MNSKGNTQVQNDPGQSEDRPRRRQEGSFVSQHASFWENTAPNIHNADPAKPRANIPARYTGDKEKLTATKQKFMQNATATTEASSTPSLKPKTEANDEVAPIKIARSSTGFSQLLQKFSGSESNSEKSDTEVGASVVSGIPKRRSLVRRQEAKEVITSSEESDTRRTPDRTQSLKLPSRREDIKSVGHSESNSSLRSAFPDASAVVEKSPSFRSEFMTRKWAGRSIDASHNEKETSPLKTVEPSKVGVGHAESKADIGISAAVSGQHNRTAFSKGQSLAVGSSDVQGQRQGLSILGNKHKDSKTTSQSTALVHNEATITKQDDAVPTATALADKSKSHSVNLDLISKYNQPPSSERLASRHVFPSSDSKQEKQVASLHIAKDTHTSVTTPGKVELDKAKNPNTVVDLVPKHKESVISDKLASVHVASQSSSENKHVIRAAEVSKQVGSSVKTAAKVAIDNTKNPNTDPDLVFSDKLASSHVASQRDSESKPDIRTVEVNISKQVDASLITTAKVSVDKTKNHNTDLDLVTKHTESVISDISASSHVASQRGSDNKPGSRAAEVSKQIDVSVTTAKKVAIDNTNNPNTELDLVSRHTVISDKLASSHAASQSSSESKRVIRAAEVSKQSGASVTTAAKVAIDKTKNLKTDLDLVSTHKESVISDKLAPVHVASQSSSENIHVIRTAEVSKQVGSSVKTAAKVAVDNTKNPNTDPDLVSRHTVISDMSPSSHVASQSSLESKPDIHAVGVNVSKQVDTSAKTAEKVLMDKVKSPNTNIDLISKHSEVPTIDMKASQRVASTNSPESKLELPSAKANIIQQGAATSVTTTVTAGMEKPKNTNLDLISESNELVTRHNSASGHVASASSSDSKPKTIVAEVNVSKLADSSVTTTLQVSKDKAKGSNTNLDLISKHSESSTREMSASHDVASSMNPERKHDFSPTTDASVTHSTDNDTSQHREHPVAKPRSSLERESTPETRVTNESSTYVQSADVTSTPSVSSTLTTSVSSPGLQTSNASSEIASSNTAEVRRASSFKEATVTRTESMEKRKGILKRNTSLNKHDTLEAAGNGGFPVIDPQLAKILMQRKQMVGDGDAIDEAEEKKDEVSELVRRPRPLSAAEEIEENLRYSMQKAAQRGINADDDEGLKRISVADRIYSMQNKIEEEKFAALTPKSRSGLSTPRSRPRSGFMTPTNQKSFDETIHQQLSMSSSMTTVTSTVATVSAVSQAATKQEEPQPSRSSTAVSGPQLMEKLSELASATERYQEKRHRFQHRARNDWRYQTQPVTYEEIQAADRYINRKKRERSQTMPITEEEVKSASEMGSGGCDIVNSSKTAPVSQPEPEVVSRSRSSSITEDDNKEVEKDDDELTKLSLSEKVKLFSQPRELEKQPAKTEAPVVRRRNRKVASRFNTQPVTNEEVEKAAASTRISPLAMSLVKPPDTEILKGLPLKDQRELVALHAEMYLSKTVFRSRSGSSASQSQTSSRRASVSLEEEEAKKSEKEDWSEKGDKKGILKDKSASAKDLHDTKSILKTEPTKAKSESEVHSILKMEVKHILEPTPVASEPRGILKKTRSEDMNVVEGGDDIKGILKHIDSEEEECQGKPRSRSNSQPLGILKSEGFSPINEHSAEIKSILKAPSQENVHDSQTIKSAMRRGSIESDISVTTATSSLKSAMRTRNRNSLDADDLQTAGADAKTVSQEGDLNSNNSQKHMSMSVQSSEVTVDHFSSVTHGKFTSVASSTIIKSSSTVESRTSSSASTTVTAATTSVSSLQVPAGSEDRSGQSASDDGESSSGEILDSTPRTSKLKRKSRFSDKTAQVERYKTQPPELPDSASSASTPADTPGRRKYKYEGRHRTQPITPDEMREAEAATPVSDLTRTPGGSIADRLNQLKTSGEQEWKKRVGRNEDILTTPEVIKLREKPGLSDHRPTSIADRLNELETSMTTWKERVEESDAKQFTVAARLTQGSTDSPLVNKLKNLPRKDESGSRGNTPLSSPVTPTKELIAKIPLPKDIVQDTSIVVEAVKTTVSSDRKKEEEDEKRESVTVEVPDMGEEVENFFAVKPIEEIKDTVNLEVDDFDNMFIEAEMILTNIHKVRPKRKIKSSSRNPLKTMSQKLEIRQEYTEVMYGTAEKELKRVKKEGLAKDAGFAQAALAGLASTENFKQVELRRTDSGSSVHGQAYDPFKEPMLLHVKGRRSVQIRLVEPHSRSINEGDCYVLVTSDKVIYWEGQFANVIEKAKANEVASYIQQKKDLGCKKAAEVQTVYPLKDHLGPGKQFWASLEGERQLQGCGPDAEDELYESSIVKCNMVYRLEGNALLPYTEYWGATLKHEMLKKNEVIVFDFGTEFYVWQGKAVSMEQRRLGMKLSKQLYEKGYNYTESPLNPMSPLRSEDCGGLSLSSPTRPSWTIFGKVNQNMETILFREKFADWPDSSRLIGCKGVAASESLNKDLLELKPFDAKKMIPINTAPVSLKLEGANVGRGVKWSEDMQGFVKEQDIITLDVTVWHVLEYEHYKLPDLSHGQFHDGDTYVVRWQYMIANANMRSLKGSAARNSLTGRERCAYFFWQGNESTINEKGASALMTVELDEERGPQIRVLQGKEPPCFLNLFDGKMIVHIGKREDPSTNSQGSWRLYCLRGDYENEVYLLEIPVSIKHLRSRSSVVLLNVKTGIVYIWHGAKSPKHVRELCLKVVNKLKENTPLEVGLHEKATITVIEVEEGEEKREIWSVLDQQDRDIYNSLLRDPKPYSHTIRLFHMSSVSLVFEVQEQLNPARVPDLTTPFPFLQSDIYKATQPALFLVDNDYEVYLWQGWWPIGSEDTENVHTGSAIARFNLDRRLAMETTLHYCKEKNPRSPPTAYLVCAGVEPVNFISLFPFWEEDSTVKDIAVEERKTPGYTEKVSDILRRLTQTRYTLTELQERPLPEGVDPLRLETYLQDAEFEEILDMNREEFYAQPNWKQIEMKKHVGLF